MSISQVGRFPSTPLSIAKNMGKKCGYSTYSGIEKTVQNEKKKNTSINISSISYKNLFLNMYIYQKYVNAVISLVQ